MTVPLKFAINPSDKYIEEHQIEYPEIEWKHSPEQNQNSFEIQNSKNTDL